MLTQRVIGAALVLLSIALALLVAHQYSVNPAFFAGEALGYALGLSLVVLLVLAATPLRRKTDAALVLGAMCLVAVAKYSADAKDRYERDRSEALAKVNESVATQSGVYESSSGEMGLIRQVMDDATKEREKLERELVQAYQESVSGGSWLLPEVLADTKRATEMRARLIRLRESLESARIKSRKLLDILEAKIASVETPEGTEMLRGFQKSKPASEQTIDTSFAAKMSVVDAATKVIDFALDKPGSFSLQDGRLMFRDQKSLDEYNGLLAAMKTEADNEVVVTKEAQDTQTQKAEVLQKMLQHN